MPLYAIFAAFADALIRFYDISMLPIFIATAISPLILLPRLRHRLLRLPR